MANQNVNRRTCKRTCKVSTLKSRGIMKKNICKKASVKKTAVSSKFMKKMAAGLCIKKGRVTVRRRTAKKSRSASRKVGSKRSKNKRSKSRKSLCKSMKRQQKKRVSSKKRNVIGIQLKKCSKSRSRSTIRRVQKKRVSSKRRSVIRKQAKARKSSNSSSTSSIRCVQKKRVASKRRSVIRKQAKSRKSSNSRSMSSIRCVQKKRVASKRRTVNRTQSRRTPKRVNHSKNRNNKKCINGAITKKRSTVKKHKHGFEKVKGIGSTFVERLGKLNITSMEDLKMYAKCTTKRKFATWLNKELCSTRTQVQNLVAEMCFIEPIKKEKTVTTEENIAATTPSKTGMLAGMLGLTSTAKPSTTDAAVAAQVAA